MVQFVLFIPKIKNKILLSNMTFICTLRIYIFIFFRNFMYYLLSPKIIKTNPLCLVKSEVVNDRSESIVDVSLGKIFFSA